jgi:hypothetical protein
MIALALFVLALSRLSLSAEPPPPADVWVTVTTSGSDAGGTASFDRFELLPDGNAHWESSAIGEGGTACGLAAGQFEAPLTPEQGRKLGRLASAAIRSQAKAPAGRPAPREIRKRVFADIDGKASEAQVQAETPEWNALLAEISELELEMQPSGAVTLRASELPGGRVRATFLYSGSAPLLLLFPADASEAFKVAAGATPAAGPGGKLRYAGDAPAHQIQLGPDKQSFSVDLAPGLEGGRLFYSNQVVLHHADADPLSGALTPKPTELCSRVRKDWPPR